ncbi:MAG: C-GCAxxG-C-C family protein [Chloroflexota bacterium]
MEDPVNTAVKLFENKSNCAQAVFAAFAPRFGVPLETALKLTSPLGGGIARRGQVCGAVNGAMLAVGLGRGSAAPEGKEATYALGEDVLRRFEALHGSIVCNQLVGYDIRDPEQYRQASEQGVFRARCPGFVRDAAVIVAELLESQG